MNSKINELLNIKELHAEKILAKPNVIGVDVGFKYVGGRRTGDIVIRAFVKKKENVSPENAVSQNIDGIPTDVIEEDSVRLQILKIPVNTPILEAETHRFNPLIGGIGIGLCNDANGYSYVGTLGAIVQKEDRYFALSTFSVMCMDSSWKKGDTIVQPSKVDGGNCLNDSIGVLDSVCLSDKYNCKNSQVDAAISAIKNREVCPNILNIGKIRGTSLPSLGKKVCKQGRTTKLTYGTVTGLGRTVSIDYGPGIGVVTLKNQITIEPDTTKNPRFSAAGDSGSVIVDEQNRVIGLLFGGTVDGSTAFANSFNDIEKALGISLFTDISVHT
ncbi:hypothetical protein [Bacillus wiedmannii]|uniref:hypothetical protein n=1 Tax=Bacillus wiedmannii TaxID=1890302 RepID=UPI000BF44850|nr:hypothetical protein [Bacillus wiedmannii]PFZ89263.1 hypothetical protein COL83_22145 [Bacillus wiedmannii]